ncbi:MAG: hypothetical protein QG610_635 [Euryarchaeota archaeon]|nr:hypothetical protein [Euryarchaeota archaeon]
MTQSEFAKHLGVSKQYVSKLIKEGKLHTEKNGQIDPLKAEKELSRNIGPVRVKIPAQAEPLPNGIKAGGEIDLDKPDISFIEARTAHEIVKTKLAQLELDLKEGQLLWKDDVEKLSFETGRYVRDAILNLPNRVCPGLPCPEDIRFKVEHALKTEIHIFLSQLSDDLGTKQGESDHA